MERRTRDDIEYKRYIYRLKKMEERRRKVMIARTIAVAVVVLFVVLFSCLVRWGVKSITAARNPKKAVATATVEPTMEPLDYSVPEGYEDYSQQLEALREDYPEVEDILLNLYEYPESILNLAVTNQETLDFVINYPKHKSDIKPSGTITEEELMDGVPYFCQWDQRWGYLNYGDDIIAIDGCGPTCLAMVSAGLLQDATKSPDAMADFSIDNNYYTPASGSSWSLMSSGAEKLGLISESVVISEDNIKAALEQEKPVICSMKPGDFTEVGHFIVLTGISENDLVSVNDPNSISRSLTEWELETLVSQMKAAWAYSVS